MTAIHKISLEILSQLKNLFIAKNWNTVGDINDSVFNDFCEMLSYLDHKQQDCILELTKKFLKVDFVDIHYYLKEALANIPKQPRNVKKFFVLPLLTKEDSYKQKSSNFLAYTLCGREIKTNSIIGVDKVIFGKRDWLKCILTNNDWKLLLVDDFIGTGETADKAITELTREIGIDKNKIIILVLVSQEEGYKKLVSQGITVVYSELRKKGISDEYVDPIRKEYIDTMESIENLLKLKSKFYFGYQRSEALVALVRTPNNTFPVFWEEKKKNNEKWPAPFSR